MAPVGGGPAGAGATDRVVTVQPLDREYPGGPGLNLYAVSLSLVSFALFLAIMSLAGG